jgi:hypothetical protein
VNGEATQKIAVETDEPIDGACLGGGGGDLHPGAISLFFRGRAGVLPVHLENELPAVTILDVFVAPREQPLAFGLEFFYAPINDGDSPKLSDVVKAAHFRRAQPQVDWSYHSGTFAQPGGCRCDRSLVFSCFSKQGPDRASKQPAQCGADSLSIPTAIGIKLVEISEPVEGFTVDQHLAQHLPAIRPPAAG